MKSFYSNGKLLLTGEYVVLDGALSLAVPTPRGQSMSVRKTDSGKLRWKSRDEKGKIWFESIFDMAPLKLGLEETNSLTAHVDTSRPESKEGKGRFRNVVQNLTGSPKSKS